MLETDIKQLIRDVPDFPKPGILFKDITPVLANGQAFRRIIEHLAELARARRAEVIAGPESRGFLFGTPLAVALGLGFVPIRKPGKLPWRRRAETYALEYGQDTLEVHEDAFRPGQRVFMVDDLLATGGTMAACCRLIEKSGAEVCGTAFLIELGFLEGRKALHPFEVQSIVRY